MPNSHALVKLVALVLFGILSLRGGQVLALDLFYLKQEKASVISGRTLTHSSF